MSRLAASVWVLCALTVFACLHATTPPSKTTSPLSYARQIWEARFQRLDDLPIHVVPLVTGRMGQARCYSRQIDLSPEVLEDPEVAIYVTLHEMTHIALWCTDHDHDESDFLMMPAFERKHVLPVVRGALADCAGDLGCVNDRIFSPEIRAKILNAQAERAE